MSYYHIQLTLHRSGIDEEAAKSDTAKVEDIYRVIQNHPGNDKYEILVRHEGWQAKLAPEQNTLHYSNTLRQHLEAVLGKGCIYARRIKQ